MKTLPMLVAVLLLTACEHKPSQDYWPKTCAECVKECEPIPVTKCIQHRQFGDGKVFYVECQCGVQPVYIVPGTEK